MITTSGVIYAVVMAGWVGIMYASYRLHKYSEQKQLSELEESENTTAL